MRHLFLVALCYCLAAQTVDPEITVDWDEADILEVVEQLQKQSALTIIIDPACVASGPAPITLQGAGTLADIFAALAWSHGLSITIQDGAWLISSTDPRDEHSRLVALPLRPDTDAKDLHRIINYLSKELGDPRPRVVGQTMLCHYDDDTTTTVKRMLADLGQPTARRWQHRQRRVAEHRQALVAKVLPQFHADQEPALDTFDRLARHSPIPLTIHPDLLAADLPPITIQLEGVNLWSTLTFCAMLIDGELTAGPFGVRISPQGTQPAATQVRRWELPAGMAVDLHELLRSELTEAYLGMGDTCWAIPLPTALIARQPPAVLDRIQASQDAWRLFALPSIPDSQHISPLHHACRDAARLAWHTPVGDPHGAIALMLYDQLLYTVQAATTRNTDTAELRALIRHERQTCRQHFVAMLKPPPPVVAAVTRTLAIHGRKLATITPYLLEDRTMALRSGQPLGADLGRR